MTLFQSRDNFKRVATAWLVMFWQQWTGIDSSMLQPKPSPPPTRHSWSTVTAYHSAVIYYASSVFQSYGFSEGTTAELATGVTGSVFMISTIPAMVRIGRLGSCIALHRHLLTERRQFLIDRLGRKTMLLTGSTIMFVTMISVGVIVAKFRHDWANHTSAGESWKQYLPVRVETAPNVYWRLTNKLVLMEKDGQQLPSFGYT